MTVLAIAPRHNSPGKRDASGAFAPEARAFIKLHGGALVDFDNRMDRAARWRWLRGTLAAFDGGGFDAVAFFCHGYRNGIQAGAHMPQAAELASFVRATGAGICVLYACDAGRDLDPERADDLAEGPGGAGGFAWELARHGLQVDAHVTAAHTTINPHVRRFPAGDWIVSPKDPLWGAWRRRLKSDRAFRLSFPLQSIAEIRAGL